MPSSSKELTAPHSIPSLRFSHLTLYRGSAISGLREADVSESASIGDGVYLATEDTARKYAKVRGSHVNPGCGKYRGYEIAGPLSICPTVYKVEMDDLVVADVRSKEAYNSLMLAFGSHLKEMAPSMEKALNEYIAGAPTAKEDDALLVYVLNSIGMYIAFMDGAVTSRDAFGSDGPFSRLAPYFTEFLQGLGFDGIVAKEHEEWNGIEEHDSYCIFYPEKVRITGSSPAV